MDLTGMIKKVDLLQNLRDLSNQEELILPKNSTKDNHRWDQSLLTVLIYKYNYFVIFPK